MAAEARPTQAGLCLSERQFRRHVRAQGQHQGLFKGQNLDLGRDHQISARISVCVTVLEDDDVQKLFPNDLEKYPQTHASFGHQHCGALYRDGRLPPHLSLGPR